MSFSGRVRKTNFSLRYLTIKLTSYNLATKETLIHQL